MPDGHGIIGKATVKRPTIAYIHPQAACKPDKNSTRTGGCS